MLSATQGLAKLFFFKYVDFEMMDHNNRAGAYEWGLQTLNISIEGCATWSNHSEKCTKWKYIKKAAGIKEDKQRNIDKTLYGLGKIYSRCIWIISYIFMFVYIYFFLQKQKDFLPHHFFALKDRINGPLQITGLCLCMRTQLPRCCSRLESVLMAVWGGGGFTRSSSPLPQFNENSRFVLNSKNLLKYLACHSSG